ncbi:MAG: hypothetical protein NWS37_04420, partial [Flavobacteriaceae bacterium]|nr:hypothetical protein [Flavobacteriaceae bacterium]
AEAEAAAKVSELKKELLKGTLRTRVIKRKSKSTRDLLTEIKITTDKNHSISRTAMEMLNNDKIPIKPL